MDSQGPFAWEFSVAQYRNHHLPHNPTVSISMDQPPFAQASLTPFSSIKKRCQSPTGISAISS